MDRGSRIADIKVGAFVVAAAVILIFGSLWVAGSTLFGVKYVHYDVALADSGGVQAGDRVRVAGVQVGRVRRIALRAGQDPPVRIEVAIRPDVPVHVDSSARVAAAGLMGGSILIIDPGSPSAERLPPGGRIRGESAPGFDAAMAHVDEIAEKTVGLLDQVAGLLDQIAGDLDPILGGAQQLLSTDNVDKIERILANLDVTLDDAGPRIASLLERLDALSADLEKGLADVPELTGEAHGLLVDLRRALGDDGERVASLLDSAQKTLASADASLGMLGDNRDEIEWTLRDLRDTVANLKMLSQQLKERPSSLIWNRGPEDRRPGDAMERSPR